MRKRTWRIQLHFTVLLNERFVVAHAFEKEDMEPHGFTPIQNILSTDQKGERVGPSLHIRIGCVENTHNPTIHKEGNECYPVTSRNYPYRPMPSSHTWYAIPWRFYCLDRKTKTTLPYDHTILIIRGKEYDATIIPRVEHFRFETFPVQVAVEHFRYVALSCCLLMNPPKSLPPEVRS